VDGDKDSSNTVGLEKEARLIYCGYGDSIKNERDAKIEASAFTLQMKK